MNFFYRLFILTFFVMSACASHHDQRCVPVSMSVACQRQNLIDSLQKAGVNVVELGDELRLILPGQRFFIQGTASLRTTAYSSLDEMVTLLNLSKNYGINVLAYSPSFADFKSNISLAQQQAQVIVDYFMQQGLSTRFIAASAWRGSYVRHRQGTGPFSGGGPPIYSIEVRTRLLQAEDSQ